MDDHQSEIIRVGEMARALLESEAFVTTVADLKGVWLGEIVGSEPHDKDKREEMYQLYIAVQAIEGIIASRVDAKDQVLALLELENNEE
jgi:hypothetical protein